MKQHTQTFSTILVAVLSATMLLTQTAVAQDAPAQLTQAPAPIEQAAAPSTTSVIPTQIATAHKVFLSNDGADTNFPIENNGYYNAIYGAMQTWGKYQLVGTPEEADLIFALHGLNTYTEYTGSHGSTYTMNNPSFQLAIVDAKTGVTLWTISSPVYLAGRGTTLTRWVHSSEVNVVSRLKVLAGDPLSAEESAELTTFPKNHGLRTALIATGGLLVLGGVAALLMHKASDDALASMKESQDKFCQENNIPLNECAGG